MAAERRWLLGELMAEHARAVVAAIPWSGVKPAAVKNPFPQPARLKPPAAPKTAERKAWENDRGWAVLDRVFGG